MMECSERCSIVSILKKQLNAKKYVDGYFMNLENENKQLIEKLQAEQQKTAKLNYHAETLQNDLIREQQAHNDLREKLKEIVECYECSGDGIGNIDWKWAMGILKQAIKEDNK